jgi:hypothetical protein
LVVPGAGGFALTAVNGIWTGASSGVDAATTGSAVAGCSFAEDPFENTTGVDDRLSDAALAVVEDLPNIERIIASAISAGDAAVP